MNPGKRWRRTLATLVALLAGTAGASSHREAPLISNMPSYDNTDVYAWRRGNGADTTVVLVANFWPAALPQGGPVYYLFEEDARYRINIDNNGDGKPDIVYQFQFKQRIDKSPLSNVVNGNSFLVAFAPVTKSKDDPNLLLEETYTLKKLEGHKVYELGSNLPVAPWNIGHVTTPNYDEIAKTAIVQLKDAKVFVGPRDDPFFVDLHRTFDFLALADPTPRDDLAGLNVLSVVIEVPACELTAGHKPVVNNAGKGFKLGIWSTVERCDEGSHSNHGGCVQVSRLGNPLINEVIVPLKFKDLFNASKPQNDAQFVPVVRDPELPYLLQARALIPKVPPPPRTDLVKALATPAEMLHLDVSVPPSAVEKRLGGLAGDPAGFPNGRRLGDDVTDITLRVVGGELYKALGAQSPSDTFDYATPASKLTDGVDANDKPFLNTFPYLASPQPGNPGSGP
ncbi:MAG: DUF4331 domain-containing protein [Archangium sp.]